MAKFRKKTVVVVVEAEQWPIDDPDDFPGIDGVIWQNGRLELETPKGNHRIKPGDWIITGVNGEKRSCNPAIFEEHYEPAEVRGSLLPCPFCGSEALIDNCGVDGFQARCTQCCARTRFAFEQETVAVIWNARIDVIQYVK